MEDYCEKVILKSNRTCHLCNGFIYCGQSGIKVVENGTRQWYHEDCWEKRHVMVRTKHDKYCRNCNMEISKGGSCYFALGCSSVCSSNENLENAREEFDCRRKRCEEKH